MTGNAALVTGASGFVGSRLVRRIVAEGWRVHAIVRPASDLRQIQRVLDYVTVHSHDGSTEGMFSIMEAASPTVVFHLATVGLARHEPQDVVPMLQANIVFATQLVEGMIAHNVYRLVNTGTFWQHYRNMEYSPACLYAASKQAFEAIIQYYVETSPLRVITLKLYDTYGPNDPRPKLFNLLEQAIHDNQSLAMSPGEQLIDAVYIDDVVEAFLVAANRIQRQKAAGRKVYTVSSGAPMRLKDIVEMYGQEIGKPVPVVWGGRPYRPREVMVPWDRGEKLPNWEAKVSLRDGIRRTIAERA